MIKKSFIIFAAVIFAFAMMGCPNGNGDPDPTPTPTPSPGEPIWPDTPAAAPSPLSGWTEVFAMAANTEIGNTHELMMSGDPTIVRDDASIILTDRVLDHYGIDIQSGIVGIELGDEIAVTGRLSNIARGGNMVLGGSFPESFPGDNRWPWFNSTSAAPTADTFTLRFTLNPSDEVHVFLVEGEHPIRIQTGNAGSMPFIIDHINVFRPPAGGGDPDVTDELRPVTLVRDDNGTAVLGHWLHLSDATGAFDLAAGTIALSGMSNDWDGITLQRSNAAVGTDVSEGDRFVVRGTGTEGETVRLHTGDVGLTGNTAIDADGNFEIVFDIDTTQAARINGLEDGGFVIRVTPGTDNGAMTFTVTGMWFGTPAP